MTGALFAPACSDDKKAASDDEEVGGAGGGGNGTGLTGANNTGATGAGASGGTPPVGGAAGFACINPLDPSCTAPDQANCVCEGCSQTLCVDGPDRAMTFADCVCPQCAADAFCGEVGNCADDGVCDPFNEGCVCADCMGHPACQ